MAMGDAGDEFSEQVLREIMNSLKDAGRWLRGSNGNGHGKVFKACKDARDKVRSAIMGDADERARPGDVVLWATSKDEIARIKGVCADMEIECKPGKRRESGITPVLLPANSKMEGIDSGDLYNPLDYEDPRLEGLMDEFSREAACERLANLAAAKAVRENSDAVYRDVEYAHDSTYNANLSFTTLKSDRKGAYIGKILDEAGIGHEISEVGDGVVSITFDSRQTPLLEPLIKDLVENSRVHAMGWERFPEFRREMRIAKTAMAEWIRTNKGENIVNLMVPKHRDAQYFSSALSKLGIANAIVGVSTDTNCPLIAVDSADLIAHDADLEQFIEGNQLEQYVLDVLEGRQKLLALPPALGEEVAGIKQTPQVKTMRVPMPTKTRAQSRFTVKRKATPEADERKARAVAKRAAETQELSIGAIKHQVNITSNARGTR